jgi:hypothetical protein
VPGHEPARYRDSKRFAAQAGEFATRRRQTGTVRAAPINNLIICFGLTAATRTSGAVARSPDPRFNGPMCPPEFPLGERGPGGDKPGVGLIPRLVFPRAFPVTTVDTVDEGHTVSTRNHRPGFSEAAASAHHLSVIEAVLVTTGGGFSLSPHVETAQ